MRARSRATGRNPLSYEHASCSPMTRCCCGRGSRDCSRTPAARLSARRHRRRPAAQGPLLQARRRDHRHPHAARLQTDEGLQAAKEIREHHPRDGGAPALPSTSRPGYALELLQESAEGVGYLLKDRVADVDQFAAAVKRVAEGGSALDPAVVSQLVGRRRRDDPLAQLSTREREVLELMAEGLSNTAIAERLFISGSAVEKHVTSIFQKLRLPAAPDTHRRVLAVLAFLRS